MQAGVDPPVELSKASPIFDWHWAMGRAWRVPRNLVPASIVMGVSSCAPASRTKHMATIRLRRELNAGFSVYALSMGFTDRNSRHILRWKRQVSALAWVGLLATVATGQQNTSVPSASPAAKGDTPAKRLAFDVISIRPSKTDAPGGGFMVLPDGYRQSAQPLVFAIMMAYLPMANIPFDRIQGAPAWVTDAPYDILAKVAPDDVAAWQKLSQNRFHKPLLEAMLQEALVERCKLTIHKEPTYAAGFALVLDKRGAKFESAGHGESAPDDAVPFTGGASVVFGQRDGAGGQQVVFYNASMASLTAFLMQGGTAIEDRTGLPGTYTFALSRRKAEPTPPEESGNQTRDPLASVPWDVQALGLDLKPAKIVQDKIVIDHIERCTAN